MKIKKEHSKSFAKMQALIALGSENINLSDSYSESKEGNNLMNDFIFQENFNKALDKICQKLQKEAKKIKAKNNF